MKAFKLLSLILMLSCFIAFAEEQNENQQAEENAAYRGRSITLRDFGADDMGFLSLPDSPPKYGVLILPDSHGLNDQIKKRCDWIAERGQIALGLDLFNGHIPKTDEEASSLQRELRPPSAHKAIEAAIRLLSESPRLRAGHVIIVAIGPQCPLILPTTRKRSPVIGITWFQPEGKFNEELFIKSKLPFQIFQYNKSPDFLKWLHENLHPKRKSITLLEKSPSSLPSDLSSHEWEEAWSHAFAFWQRCATGIYAPKKGFFESIWDELQ